MAGKWKVNVFLGFSGFLVTYLFSITNNTWQTTIIRAVFGLIFFYLLGLILRYVLSLKGANSVKPQLKGDNTKAELKKTREQKQNQEKGTKEDIPFQAISLHSLHKVEELHNPENIANDK